MVPGIVTACSKPKVSNTPAARLLQHLPKVWLRCMAMRLLPCLLCVRAGILLFDMVSQISDSRASSAAAQGHAGDGDVQGLQEHQGAGLQAWHGGPAHSASVR